MQSDKEKKDGLPIAAFMERDRVTKPSAQIGFIRYVLLPLFESLSKVWHNNYHTYTHYCYIYFQIFIKLYSYLPYILPQLFPEFEEISLRNLRNALTYYENLKEKEEIKKVAANSDNNSELSQNLSIVQ